MFSLIPLTIDDGGVLEQIHSVCFPDGWSRDTFDHLLTESLTCGWMATSLDEIPVGFILARVIDDEAEILTFAVHPSVQRAGIGRSLLKELMNFLRSVNCVKIYLEVAVDNEAAISLYSSLGFTNVGMRSNYYRRTHQSPCKFNGQTFISASIMVYEDTR